MVQDNDRKILFSCPANYNLYEVNNKEVSSGEITVQLSENDISVLPKFADVIFCPFRDITTISEHDYEIHISLSSNETLIINNLGYKFDDFLRVLFKLYNESMLHDLLMNEAIRKSGVTGDVIFVDEHTSKIEYNDCDLRLYDTAIVLIPQNGELRRVPYCDVSTIKEVDYTLEIATEFGETLIISKMGKKYDSFVKTLSSIINELSIKSQSYLKELLPEANPSVIRRASQYMKEGKAARKIDIDSISPEIWNSLETRIAAYGIKKEYDFIKNLSQQDKICIGLKRDLLGDMTGEYIWFLVPIYSEDHTIPGNAIAMEAGSTEGTGKATYFFRITDREAYTEFSNLDDLNKICDELINQINRCMLAINFRREPIYLPQEKIDDPRYDKYRFAIQKIPELRKLRSLFIGRIIHSSIEQWKEDVMDLLEFNVSIADNNKRWNKLNKRKPNNSTDDN